MITVACVLKSGGVYDQEWVYKLFDMVHRHTSIPFRAVCLTDTELDNTLVERIPLTDDLEGWWSKVELFKLPGPVVYLDLDTVIRGDIDRLLEPLTPNSFYMLTAFNPMRKWASGIMAWEGDLSAIHRDFRPLHLNLLWDQRYIARAADKLEQRTSSIQVLQPGIVSWKTCCSEPPTEQVKIICFHGETKQHNCGWDWVEREWG